MKNQYFGDINDYRKYGLLRLLSGSAKLSTAVCWMLTADDGRSDGKKVRYLKQPRPWRGFDPDLYDTLRELVLSREIRNVNSAEASGILPSARYFPELLSDDQQVAPHDRCAIDGALLCNQPSQVISPNDFRQPANGNYADWKNSGGLHAQFRVM